ncbi:hypothetical protein [Paenibacillus cisolokensis]|uniref:hypothetical protein n=1 Tax=Paenibacillus cisolokensis TaxID=1658519 RepID=UPI001BD00FD2|nr:hypothetical protein [Paenibacillus cisolokensis]
MPVGDGYFSNRDRIEVVVRPENVFGRMMPMEHDEMKGQRRNDFPTERGMRRTKDKVAERSGSLLVFHLIMKSSILDGKQHPARVLIFFQGKSFLSVPVSILTDPRRKFPQLNPIHMYHPSSIEIKYMLYDKNMHVKRE